MVITFLYLTMWVTYKIRVNVVKSTKSVESFLKRQKLYVDLFFNDITSTKQNKN